MPACRAHRLIAYQTRFAVTPGSWRFPNFETLLNTFPSITPECESHASSSCLDHDGTGSTERQSRCQEEGCGEAKHDSIYVSLGVAQAAIYDFRSCDRGLSSHVPNVPANGSHTGLAGIYRGHECVTLLEVTDATYKSQPSVREAESPGEERRTASTSIQVTTFQGSPEKY